MRHGRAGQCAGCARPDRSRGAARGARGLSRPLDRIAAHAVPLRQLGRLRHGRAHRYHLVQFDRLPPVRKGAAAGALCGYARGDRRGARGHRRAARRPRSCGGERGGLRRGPVRSFGNVGGRQSADGGPSGQAAHACPADRPARERGGRQQCGGCNRPAHASGRHARRRARHELDPFPRECQAIAQCDPHPARRCGGYRLVQPRRDCRLARTARQR